MLLPPECAITWSKKKWLIVIYSIMRIIAFETQLVNIARSGPDQLW